MFWEQTWSDVEAMNVVNAPIIKIISNWCYKTFFGGKLENLDFPLNWNSKKLALEKVLNSFRDYCCYKCHCFHFFVQVHASEQTFFNFLILGNLDFLKKKVL